MKKMNFILVLNTSLLFTLITKAQDQPEPVNGIFSVYDYQFDYYSSVRKILLNKLSDNPEARVLMLPSFSPEIVLDIEKNELTINFTWFFIKPNKAYGIQM